MLSVREGCLLCPPFEGKTPEEPGSTWEAWKRQFYWFRVALGVESLNFVLNKKADNDSQLIGGFEFVMPLRLDNPTVVLNFTTNRDILMKSFGFESVKEWAVAGMGNYGLRSGSTALLFALDSQLVKNDAASSITLLDVANFVGLESLFTSGWLQFLGSIPLQFPGLNFNNNEIGSRNAVWFIPKLNYRTVTRLQLQLASEAKEKIKALLRKVLGSYVNHLDLNECYVVGRKESVFGLNVASDVNNGSFGAQTRGSLGLIFKIPFLSFNFTVVVEFSAEVVKVSLTSDDNTEGMVTELCAWLASITELDSKDLDMSDWFGRQCGGMKFPHWQFRRVMVELTEDTASPNEMQDSTVQDAPSFKLSHFSIDLELLFEINKEIPLLFLISYDYIIGSGSFLENSSLEGKLWLGDNDNSSNPKLWVLPDFEPYHYLNPVTVDKLPGYLDLSTIHGFDQLPSWVPTLVSEAKIHLDKKMVGFSGTMRGKKPDTTKLKVPVFIIDEINLFTTYTFGEDPGSGFTAILEVSALLWPPPDPESPDEMPAELKGALFYEKKSWYLSASLENLTGGCITKFFDESAQPAIGDVLKPIRIETLTASYTYNDKEANSLTVGGVLLIDKFALSVNYAHNGTQNWFFGATISRDDPGNKDTFATVESIIEDLTGSNPYLPEFIGNVRFKFASENKKDTVGFYMASTPGKSQLKIADDDHQLFITAYLKFGGLLTQFIQLRALSPAAKSENSLAEDPPSQPETKRILVTALQSLPKVIVPVLGDVTQPFDEVLFLWVQSKAGITKAELDIINEFLTTDELKIKALPFKKTTKADPAPQTIVLTSGFHIMLVLKDNKGEAQCVLDYQFTKEQTANEMALLISGDTDTVAEKGSSIVSVAADRPGKPSGMVNYSKKIGPLAISNLGFDFANNVFSIKIDALVTLGPIVFELIGFSLNLDFSKTSQSEPWSLHNLPDPDFKLSGLAISYDKAPLEIAGMLLLTSENGMDLYQGAVTAGFTPWEFSAAGCYGEVKPPLVPEPFHTAFLYCRLNGPLLTMAYAEISGVTGGFGYNSHMRLPTAVEVPKFPLMNSQGSKQKASEIQNALFKAEIRWIVPQKDSFWIAAGFTVKAFNMLTIQAVVVVEWDPSVKLALFAIATASIPAVPNPKIRFAYVELAISAIVDFGAGTMKIDGQLTPASFILHPDCHLTEGFALYSWFGGPADTQSDSSASIPNGWVFTLGGYHSAFHAPPQYPSPPRLGISWDLGPVKLLGEAYFAITPKVCMGGGIWNVSLSAGPLQAFYTTYVDFLINFQPFHFVADGGLAVGVRFTLDLWLVTIHISVDIAAQLHIEGPPIHGTVHVDFWVFGFDVKFGDSTVPRPPPLLLAEFIHLACQIGKQDSSSFIETITADTRLSSLVPQPEKPVPSVPEDPPQDDSNAFVLSVENGLVPSTNVESRPSGGDWIVRCAVFSFTVTCKFALQSASIVTHVDGDDIFDFPVAGTIDDNGKPIPVNARPMALDVPLTKSTLKVQIEPGPGHPMLLDLQDNSSTPIWDQNKPITNQLPAGLWGAYDPSADPVSNPNNPDLLNGTKSASIPLLTAVRISRPDDKQAKDDTLKPYPYGLFMLQQISPPTVFPVLETQDPHFLPGVPDIVPVDPKTGKPKRKSKQWSWVREQWMSPAKGIAMTRKVVELWSDFALGNMGWDVEKLSEGLSWVQPGELIKDLENRYVRAPLISVV